MFVKMFWENCPEFVVEEEDAFLLEASPSEASEKVLPALSAHEKLKFDQMKDIYCAKATTGRVHEGCYYFLVSRDAHTIKFESVAIMSADLSARGGKVRPMPDLPLATIDELGSIDPTKY